MVRHIKLESRVKVRNKFLGTCYLTVRSEDLGVGFRKQLELEGETRKFDPIKGSSSMSYACWKREGIMRIIKV